MISAPDYVSFEARGRDELLSQIGSFTPAERDLFQRLCDMWSPEIDARHVIGTGESGPEQEQSTLERLFAKLTAARIGFLTRTATDTGSEPDKVILTSKGSLVYWEHVVSDTVAGLLHKGFQILPSEARLKDARALPPDYHIFDSDSGQLVEAYAGAVTEPTVFRLRLMEEFRIVYTPAIAKELVTRAIGTLRRDLMERGIVDELARLLDTSIAETRQALNSKAIDSWLKVSTTIVKERGTIAFRKNFEERDEIFQLAYLVMIFVDAQIGAARLRKEHEHVVLEQLEIIAKAVLGAEGGVMEEPAFAALVEEAQERAGEGAAMLAKRLSSDLLSPRAKRKLPRIAALAGTYIHSARVRSLFEHYRRETGRALSNEYADIMEAFLRGRTAEIGEVFSSRELLNEDIGRRVRRTNATLAAMIAQPQLLAEAVILDAKNKREGVPQEELKRILSAYFDVESSELLPLNELLSVNVADIYDEAYGRVGVLRQFLLRFSGRHESLRATYVRRFGPRKKRTRYNESGSTLSAGGDRTEIVSETSGTRTRGTGNRSHKPETVSAKRTRIPTVPPKPRTKSPREIDKVWSEFDEALHTRSRRGTEE